MHAQTTTTPAQAPEATPPIALKAKRAALTGIQPGEATVQAAIRATEAQRKVMDAAYEAYTAAEGVASKAKGALKAVPFPDELVVPVTPKITDDPLTWVTAIVCRHPDGREVRNEVRSDRALRLETREAIVAHFGEDHPELQERLAAFVRWNAETSSLRRALDKAKKAEEKADRAWQRSYELNDRLCRAILKAPAEPHEARQQADAYMRLLASNNGRDVNLNQVMYGEEAAPLLQFMHAALQGLPSGPKASPMLDVLAERNRVVDHLNGDSSDLSEEEFDRQHDIGWDLNNQILDDNSLTPDSALAKLRLILRADVVEGLQFNEESVLEALRTAIAVIEDANPSLRREDAELDQADRAGVWIDDFLSAGGSIIREDGGKGPDRVGFHRVMHGNSIEQRDRGSALLNQLHEAPTTFAKEVKRIAVDRMIHADADLLSSPTSADPVAIAAE